MHLPVMILSVERQHQVAATENGRGNETEIVKGERGEGTSVDEVTIYDSQK